MRFISFHFGKKLNFNLATECLLGRSKTLKLQNFVEKFPKSICKNLFDVLGKICLIKIESARRFLPYFTMFGISEFSLI